MMCLELRGVPAAQALCAPLAFLSPVALRIVRRIRHARHLLNLAPAPQHPRPATRILKHTPNSAPLAFVVTATPAKNYATICAHRYTISRASIVVLISTGFGFTPSTRYFFPCAPWCAAPYTCTTCPGERSVIHEPFTLRSTV